jgi:hypothetical protein
MKIKVACDATILATEYGQAARRSGIYTEADEIAKHLNQMDDIDLNLVCICCNPNYFYGSLLFAKYVKNGMSSEGYSAISSIGSRLRLTGIFRYSRYV